MCCLWVCVKKAKINYVIQMSSCSGLYICMFYANSCILCSAQILIYILHSNRSSRFLLFITNCNSDNRKKGATFPFFFFFFCPDWTSLSHNGFYQLSWKRIYRSILTGYFCKCQSKRHFWWSHSVLEVSHWHAPFHSWKPLLGLHFTFGNAFQ